MGIHLRRTSFQYRTYVRKVEDWKFLLDLCLHMKKGNHFSLNHHYYKIIIIFLPDLYWLQRGQYILINSTLHKYITEE